MNEENKELRMMYLTTYLRQVAEDVMKTEITFFDMLENDMGAFIRNNSAREIPETRLIPFLKYTERLYIDGCEEWQEFTGVFFKDVNRALELTRQIAVKLH